jgi:hypothetical protein
MKLEIENLKSWIYGKNTTGYQRALAMGEFEKLLDYVAELEQLRQPAVISSLPCHHNFIQKDTYWKSCTHCGMIAPLGQ